jgi:flagellar biosynthesis protein FliR
MDLYAFGLTNVITFLLVLARVGGIFTTAPIFGNVNVAPMVRVAIALALAFVFFPMARIDSVSTELLPFVAMVMKEAIVGLSMGFLASLMFAAIQMAGSLVDLQVGFGFAQVVDPMTKDNHAVLSQLQNLAATLLFLAVNGHHLMISGLADSFSILPLGEMAINGAAVGGLVEAFAGIFLAALKIGAPVVGAIFLTDVALGILARTVPQLNVFVVGLPAKMAVAMFAMIAIMPLAFAVMTHLFVGLHRDLVLLIRTLAT